MDNVGFVDNNCWCVEREKLICHHPRKQLCGVVCDIVCLIDSG